MLVSGNKPPIGLKPWETKSSFSDCTKGNSTAQSWGRLSFLQSLSTNFGSMAVFSDAPDFENMFTIP